MIFIRKMAEYIREELDKACEYIDCAIEQKSKYPDISGTLFTLGKEELVHADRLHARIVELIKQMKDIEIPKAMLELWDFEHKIYIEKKEKIEFKITQYSKY